MRFDKSLSHHHHNWDLEPFYPCRKFHQAPFVVKSLLPTPNPWHPEMNAVLLYFFRRVWTFASLPDVYIECSLILLLQERVVFYILFDIFALILVNFSLLTEKNASH